MITYEGETHDRAFLQADQARSFNSRCMRNLFVALDRPGSKEVSRAKTQRTINVDETLDGVARYHALAPRLLWCYQDRRTQR